MAGEPPLIPWEGIIELYTFLEEEALADQDFMEVDVEKPDQDVEMVPAPSEAASYASASTPPIEYESDLQILKGSAGFATISEKENLCLFGLPDGTWKVNVPPDEAPPDMPEPVTGINFCRRGGMEEKQWRSFIAEHSDVWLLALTFYLGADSGLSQESRKVLFEMMSDLPTMYEVVTGVDNEPTNERTPNNSSESNKSPSQPVQFYGTIKFKCIYKPCKHHIYFHELRNIR
ncbi:PHD finger protein ALFIN-LIKE 8-like protein [Carex littledalei]|uniref:PHD finger protein ALFIN-LIKE n=1 Tax=Carex littledalei TaxID=544730 RepID=A0A833VT35_9POAL|nr:PHD finger protein ALFIN-LIKE 8-like protein [Carex littledalei]